MNKLSLLTLFVGFLGAQSSAQQFTYVPINVQCATTATAESCPAGLMPGQVAPQTSAKGINARGDIVGFYIDSAKHQHGFLLKDGQFASLDFNDSKVSSVRVTIANGINPEGDIVGQYTLPVNDPKQPFAESSPLYCPTAPDPACIKGFLYRHGKFSTIMFPGHPGAIAQRITPDGHIYGCLHDHDLGNSMFGAVWSGSDNASLTADGGETTDGMAMPMSMNNGATPGGQVIGGLWVDMNSQQHGFLVRDGMFQPYDPTSTTILTAIWDMNPSQHFVGTYIDAGARHGFLQLPDGSAPIKVDVTFQDASGNVVTALATIAFGINPDGVIVGQYTVVSGGAIHGFAAMPVSTN